jgi:hypothetical protein
MPDVREVYEMVTKQKPPEPGALERQQKRQVRAARNRRYGAFAVAAVIGVVAVAVISVIGPGSTQTPPASGPSRTVATDPSAMAAATGFIRAVETFQPDRASSFLADDADLSHVSGITPEQLPSFIRLLRAQDYRQVPSPCEITEMLASGTVVHCPFAFDAIRSDELGLGPYRGSSWDIKVLDGRIVDASLYWETSRFSGEVWEPFARWVSQTHPDDVTKMYTDEGQTDWRLTDESIRLWDELSREYALQANR